MQVETTENQMAEDTIAELTEEAKARIAAWCIALRQTKNLSYEGAERIMLRKMDQLFSIMDTALDGLDRGWTTAEQVVEWLRELMADHDFTYNTPPRERWVSSGDEAKDRDRWEYWVVMTLSGNCRQWNKERLERLAQVNTDA